MSRQEDFKQMAKTLAELHRECEKIGHRVTDANLPLKMYGKNCEVGLKLYGDNGNYWVEVRSSIDLDEKVAIIMQMFEDGTNDSIAMAVANKIKQGVVDKACEWLKKYAANFVALPDEGQQPIGDTNAIYGTKSLLYYLRKAMEE